MPSLTQNNGLLSVWGQTNISTNVGLLFLIGPMGTHFSNAWNKIPQFSFKNMHLKVCKMAAILSKPQCFKTCVTKLTRGPFTLINQIWWKLQIILIQTSMIRFLHHFAHGIIVAAHTIGILRGYAMRSGRRPEGSQRLQVPFIQYKYVANIAKVKLWNYKSNGLPKTGLPTWAWHRQPSHQLDKGVRGPKAQVFIE